MFIVWSQLHRPERRLIGVMLAIDISLLAERNRHPKPNTQHPWQNGIVTRRRRPFPFSSSRGLLSLDDSGSRVDDQVSSSITGST